VHPLLLLPCALSGSGHRSGVQGDREDYPRFAGSSRMRSAEIPAEIRLVALDLDGVVYRGRTLLPGVEKALSAVRDRGLELRFVTNNSTLHRSAVAARLVSYGLQVEESQILTSGAATASWVADRVAADSRILVVGEGGLLEELGEVGMYPFYPVDRGGSWGTDPDLSPREGEEGVTAVVVGLDRAVSYGVIAAAQAAIRDGALYVATNIDATYPVEGGVLPGAGAVAAAVTAAAGREPVVVGKPSSILAEVLSSTTGISSEETLFVGDRLETDIALGVTAGMHTLLVLTGVTARGDLQDSKIRADHVLADLRDLPSLLDSVAAREVDFLPVSSLQRCELLFQSGNLILHLLHLHELVGTKCVGWQPLAHIFQPLPPRVEALTQILS